MKGDGTYTKLARNDSEKRTTYLLTPFPSGLTALTIRPPVTTSTHSSRIVFERTHASDVTRPKRTACRSSESTPSGGRRSSGSVGGGGGGVGGGGRSRWHFDMKKKGRKKVLPGKPAGLYIHINAE